MVLVIVKNFTFKRKRVFLLLGLLLSDRKKLNFSKKSFKEREKLIVVILAENKDILQKDCPKKKEKSAKMVSQLMINNPDSDIKSVFSEQSQIDEHTVFALEDSSSASSSDNDDSSQETSLPIFVISQNVKSSNNVNSSNFSLQINKMPPSY
jgi:hypothetical protein